MPKVGGKKYAYTAKGKAAAKKAMAKKKKGKKYKGTGKSIKKKKVDVKYG